MRAVRHVLILLLVSLPMLSVAATGPVGERLPSADEMLSTASKTIEEMKATLDKALVRLEKAKAKPDVIQVNCLKLRLSSLKGLLKILEQAEVSLKEAITQKNKELVTHEFTKISIARSRGENLRMEVEGCVGEASQYTGPTVVEKTIDEDIRTDDPTTNEAATQEPLDRTRPPSVSGAE